MIQVLYCSQECISQHTAPYFGQRLLVDFVLGDNSLLRV